MRRRGKWQGMWTIARLNWPFYVAALLALLVSIAGVFLVDALWLRVSCALAGLGALYFLVFSLGVAHLVYDRSDLYRWAWLQRVLRGATPAQAILCHAGFDEASAFLKAHTLATAWTILDHYDAARMTEPSIHRARRWFPPAPGTIATPQHTWPLEAGAAGLVLGLLAIHEFRGESERSAWFSEARRCAQKGGRVVLVEHLRNFANLLAFGPGFLHFHSRASWQRCWQAAGLHLIEEFDITPWVRVFVLSPA